MSPRSPALQRDSLWLSHQRSPKLKHIYKRKKCKTSYFFLYTTPICYHSNSYSGLCQCSLSLILIKNCHALKYFFPYVCVCACVCFTLGGRFNIDKTFVFKNGKSGRMLNTFLIGEQIPYNNNHYKS